MSFSGTFGRGQAERIGQDADRSATVLSIFRRNWRGWSEHLRHLYVRIWNATDPSRPSLQPRVPRQVHRQMAQGKKIFYSTYSSESFNFHSMCTYRSAPIGVLDFIFFIWPDDIYLLFFSPPQSNRTCPICRGDASEFFHNLDWIGYASDARHCAPAYLRIASSSLIFLLFFISKWASSLHHTDRCHTNHKMFCRDACASSTPPCWGNDFVE